MVRWRFNETTKNGKEHDHSAPPVYLSHIEQAIQALAKTGTPEDTSRKFAILTCWVRGWVPYKCPLCWPRMD